MEYFDLLTVVVVVIARSVISWSVGSMMTKPS